MLEVVRRLFPLLPRVVALATALLFLGAGPAMADPAGPSDFRSEVTGIVPDVDGVEAEVRGGDAFLEVHVERGHEVVVEGYSDEPYLRFRADGTVERNRRSPATYVNNDRRGRGSVPADADPTAEPVWEAVASGGTYAWHDHRIHWMQDSRPPVGRGERVLGEYDPWRVAIEVDGTPVVIEGTLTYEDAMSPIPWAALGLLLAALVGWFGRRRAVVAAPAALAVVAALAAVVGRADFSSTPGGGNPLLWVLPAVALLTAVVALVPAARRVAVIGTLASVASLSGWALLRIGVLTKPVLPSDLPAGLDRATVAAGIGVAVAAAYLAVTSGELRLPDLPDD